MATGNINPTKVETIRHQDKRANISTEELRDFVADDEAAPKMNPELTIPGSLKIERYRR